MRRKKIALIGGGHIGGVLALMATQKELGDLVVLDLPRLESVVKGKALDIMAMRPHQGVDVALCGSSDYADIAGSDLVIITAGVARKPGMSRNDLLEINTRVTREVALRVKEQAPDAFVILTTNPVDAMSLLFQKVSGFPKQRVVGMSGTLDSGRFRTFVAMETGLSVEDVSGMVIGLHGPRMIPIIRTANVGGIPLSDLLPPERIQAIVERTRNAGTELVELLGEGSAYFSPASAVLEIAEAYLKDKKRVIPCAALCEGEYGVNGYYIGAPCVIGGNGVERVIEFPLTDEEQEQMDRTSEAARATADELGI